jgi:Flp pilus assembly protein TadD
MRRWRVVGVSLLFVVVGEGPSVASAAGAGLPDSALVVVMSRFFEGERAGNGFIAGDGTLVITNDHLVYEESEQGAHRLEGRVEVFSPYLGEACDARILVTDEEFDLAVLEVPWKGHPSLGIADVNAVMDARSARIVGLPAVVKRLEDWDSEGAPGEVFKTQEEELPVAFVGVRERAPQFITLSGVRQVGPGWSGSAMLLPGTSTAVGCFNTIHRTSRDERASGQQAAGPVVCRVLGLLNGSSDNSRLCRADTLLECPQDAHEACSLALRGSSSLRPGQYASALEAARAFLRLRPASGLGHKVVAYASEKLGQKDTAREYYRRAVELDANSLNNQILYAQFLAENGDPNGAQQILNRLWKAGRSRDMVAIAFVNLWGEEGEFSRCLAILAEATRINPRNAYLWQQMAACRAQAQGPAAAIEPLTRAVELYPERGPFRGTLARLLEMTGQLDEAERHFRKLLEVEPENPVVYCWLAQFLSKHRPQAVEEALSIAEKALGLPPNASLPREKIEAMVMDLRDRMSSSTPQ